MGSQPYILNEFTEDTSTFRVCHAGECCVLVFNGIFCTVNSDLRILFDTAHVARCN